MQKQKQPKLFAFKLAEKQVNTQTASPAVPPRSWKVRSGIAVAGCSEFMIGSGNFRYESRLQPNDSGQYC